MSLTGLPTGRRRGKSAALRPTHHPPELRAPTTRRLCAAEGGDEGRGDEEQTRGVWTTRRTPRTCVSTTVPRTAKSQCFPPPGVIRNPELITSSLYDALRQSPRRLLRHKKPLTAGSERPRESQKSSPAGAADRAPSCALARPQSLPLFPDARCRPDAALLVAGQANSLLRVRKNVRYLRAKRERKETGKGNLRVVRNRKSSSGECEEVDD